MGEASLTDEPVLRDMYEAALKNPGDALVLQRPPEAYPYVFMYLNTGKISRVHCLAALVIEAKFLGLQNLERLAQNGNFFGWRNKSKNKDIFFDPSLAPVILPKARASGELAGPREEVTVSVMRLSTLDSWSLETADTLVSWLDGEDFAENKAITRLKSESNAMPFGKADNQRRFKTRRPGGEEEGDEEEDDGDDSTKKTPFMRLQRDSLTKTPFMRLQRDSLTSVTHGQPLPADDESSDENPPSPGGVIQRSSSAQDLPSRSRPQHKAAVGAMRRSLSVEEAPGQGGVRGSDVYSRLRRDSLQSWGKVRVDTEGA